MKTNNCYDICAIKAAIKMGSQLLKELYNLGCIDEPELWEQINGFPNYYVSNMGRVYNAKTENLLTCEPKRGYKVVNLYINGVVKSKAIHRLVAEAFCPKPADSKKVPMCVDHINRNKLDNRACNLRWVTYQQNCMNKDTSKHNVEPVRVINLDTGIVYDSISEASKDTGIAHIMISQAINEKCANVTAGGYRWGKYDDMTSDQVDYFIKKHPEAMESASISDDELYSIDSSIDDTEDINTIDEFEGATMESLNLFGDGCYDED